MHIQINEVWNRDGKTEELAVIEPDGNPFAAVRQWIAGNRPDLTLADGLYSHGYHAVQISIRRENPHDHRRSSSRIAAITRANPCRTQGI